MAPWLGTETTLPMSWHSDATTTSRSAPARSALVAVCRQCVSWSTANPSTLVDSIRKSASTVSPWCCWLLADSTPICPHCSAVDSSMRVNVCVMAFTLPLADVAQFSQEVARDLADAAQVGVAHLGPLAGADGVGGAVAGDLAADALLDAARHLVVDGQAHPLQQSRRLTHGIVDEILVPHLDVALQAPAVPPYLADGPHPVAGRLGRIVGAPWSDDLGAHDVAAVANEVHVPGVGVGGGDKGDAVDVVGGLLDEPLAVGDREGPVAEAAQGGRHLVWSEVCRDPLAVGPVGVLPQVPQGHENRALPAQPGQRRVGEEELDEPGRAAAHGTEDDHRAVGEGALGGSACHSAPRRAAWARRRAPRAAHVTSPTAP